MTHGPHNRRVSHHPNSPSYCTGLLYVYVYVSHILQTRATHEESHGANVSKLLHNVVIEWNVAMTDPAVGNASNMAVAKQLAFSLSSATCTQPGLTACTEAASYARLLGPVWTRTRTPCKSKKLLELHKHRLTTDVTRTENAYDTIDCFPEQQPTITG